MTDMEESVDFNAQADFYLESFNNLYNSFNIKKDKFKESIAEIEANVQFIGYSINSGSLGLQSTLDYELNKLKLLWREVEVFDQCYRAFLDVRLFVEANIEVVRSREVLADLKYLEELRGIGVFLLSGYLDTIDLLREHGELNLNKIF